jgi:UDP-N-acetylmuramate dehydrogenase
MNIQKSYPLKDLNTFGIDVKAQLFANIKSEEQLLSLLIDKKLKEMPKCILGCGSNILLTQDFAGIVIKNSIPEIKIIKQDEDYVWIKAGAGVIWHQVVLFCVERNLGGIENLSLIPGTVGAAPIQNIGAYGQEIKDVFEYLEGLYIDSGDKKIFTSNQCKFGYRDSIFKHELKNKFVITFLVLRLSKKPELKLEYGTVKEELQKLNLENFTIKNVSDVICKIRQSKLPDPKQIANAGSFFKNPEIGEDTFLKLKKEFPAIIGYPLENKKVKLAAGWLIEQCGWKGKRVGNTGSHSKQALVLVNYGGAKGSDILALAEQIKESVKNKFGIKLDEEINII